MSRYRLESPDPQFEIHVGWDRPLNTFFAQVKDLTIDEDDEEKDPIIFWIGTKPSEVLNLTDLVKSIEKYAIVPNDMIRTLRYDCDVTKKMEDTPLQKRMKGILK